ncbi:helix-turn-helix domain-containing protein [Pseudomonas typographi]|uniref:helix-turn-helix domain-containing protein n=1 Tax=Pseudomonas typographi TaxID=2715964 RepID=UPI0016842990|nr:helix-turn-helix domain-containing protein [Pseudomonas typographi]MBD1588848.1 AraC family transcriptional regulator [Pseudomonas typographi]
MQPLRLHSPGTFHSIQSFDAQEHASHFSEWEENRYNHLRPQSAFHGVIDMHQALPQAQITRETIHSHNCMEQLSQVASGSVVLVNVESTSEVLINGRYVRDSFFHISSGVPFHVIAMGAVQGIIISMDKDFFFEQFASYGYRAKALHAFERFINPSRIMRQEFADCSERHFSQLQSSDTTKEAEQASFARIMGCVGDVLEFETAVAQAPLARSTRAYIVEKSCELFSQKLHDEEYGILDLCHELRISRRTLQYSFESVLHMGASAYFRSVRLNYARQLLKTSPDAHIRNTALRAGFNHPGRFSQYYLDFYGELPSVTIERAQRPAGLS